MLGGGHNPFWRSDVIVDMFPDDDSHRGEKINIGNRFFIEGDGCSLPFKENSIDYIWSNHTIEHSKNPQEFCKSMSTVAKRGYLGAPSEIYEMLFNSHDYHLWVLNIDEGKLEACKKDKEFIKMSSYFGRLFGFLQNNSELFNAFYRGHFDIFKVNINWEYDIACDIRNKQPLFDFENNDKLMKLIQKQGTYAPRRHNQRASKLTKKELISKMVNPVTKNSLFEKGNKIIDPEHGVLYTIVDDYKFMKIDS
jgi:hypothetical protein